MKLKNLGCVALALLLVAVGFSSDPQQVDELNKSLFQAAADGNTEQVAALLSQGADANARDNVGQSPLHISAVKDCRDIIALLLAKGAQINPRDTAGRTPLHYAVGAGGLYGVGDWARTGDPNTARLLLDKGADIDAVDQEGWTPLHYATRVCREPIVRLLLERGADSSVTNKRGRTPLSLVQKMILQIQGLRAEEQQTAEYTRIAHLLRPCTHVYYVSPDGDDSNPGTRERPLGSVQAAVDAAGPGDSIVVRSGTYRVRNGICLAKPGTAGMPITLRAWPGDSPVLDFSLAKGIGIRILAAYWHVKGLTVINAEMNGIRVEGERAHHNIIEQTTTRANQLWGIGLIDGAAWNLLLNCDSCRNFDVETNGENADGICVVRQVGKGNVVIGCRSWNNADDGYDMWEAGNSVRLEMCYAWRNGTNIWNHPFYTGNANGFKLGQREGAHLLIRCAAWDQPRAGFDLNGNSTGVALYHCTGMRNKIDFAFQYPGGDGKKNILRNNLSYEGSVEMHAQIDNLSNSWNTPPGVAVSQADFLSLDDSIIAGARNPDGSIPESDFLRLAPDNNAIDAGTDVGLFFTGKAPDLGAFEHDAMKAARQSGIGWLHQAVRDHDIEKIRAELSKGIDVNQKDWLGYTPLHWACYFGYADMAETLLAAKADPNLKSDTGRTPIEIATAMNYQNVVDLLRQNVAKLADPIQSFHKAVADHNITQVKSLLSQGIDVNGKDETGDTPLHYTARLAKDAGKDVCELLIANGASINATNKVGWTPLHTAVESGNLEVARLLITDGADVNARDSSGRVPLYLAAAGGHTEIAELLNRHIHIPSPAEASFADSTPDLILTPESSIAPQQFGCYVDSADVNGDGYDDCLVTASNYNNDQGRVYLYCGGPAIDERPDKVFSCEATGDLFGEGAALGDVNGDHFADAIIGAIRYNQKQGRVLIYYGGPDMDTDPDVILEGERGTSGRFGRVIDTADIDRDGYADLVVNALFYASETGRAYLYYGGNPMNTVPAKIFDGENPGDMFGREMDMGGDVNGDGYGDLIFGCRAWSSLRGRAYLYYGGPRDSIDNTCDKILTGESAGDEFGSSVCLFDVDKDGYADVMIGARKYSKNTPRSFEGRMYMYWGGPTIALDADLIFEGEKGVGGCLGGDSIQCGYFNSDGYPDIVVSAWGYRTSQGRVCLYYGGTRASIDTVCDHTFTGETGTEASMYGVIRIMIDSYAVSNPCDRSNRVSRCSVDSMPCHRF